MQRVQRDTLGLREMLLRIEVSDGGTLRYRPVFPDLAQVKPHPDDPMRMQSFAELRRRKVGTEWRWLWDVFELSDDGEASYRVLGDRNGEPDRGTDLSPEVLGGAKAGEDYRFRYEDGTPFIPAVMYHAAVTGKLWDPFEWCEVVEATLNVGVLWSFWAHVVRDASWPQRYGLGVTVAGASAVGGGQTRRREVVTDPASVVMFEPLPNFEGQPSLGQFDPGGDPVAIAESVAAYERRVIAFIGMSPSDIHRVSGDPRSGYALAITRDAQREHQTRLEPAFSRSDRETLRKSAALWNRWAEGAELPDRLAERGWRARYPRSRCAPTSAASCSTRSSGC